METNRLIKFYERSLEDEKFLLEKIKTKESVFVQSLVGVNDFLALHSMFVMNNITLCKQFFYNAAYVSFYIINKYNANFYTSIYKLCYAILSDDNTLIEKFSKITKEHKSQIMGRLFVQNFQNALNDNYNEGDIEELRQLIKKKPKGFQGLDDFFVGLQNKNLHEVEKALKTLISNHGKRGELELYKDYISFEVTALAKLAWRLGIEVEINSPLVPKELLPIKPLDNYIIPYEFLK